MTSPARARPAPPPNPVKDSAVPDPTTPLKQTAANVRRETLDTLARSFHRHATELGATQATVKDLELRDDLHAVSCVLAALAHACESAARDCPRDLDEIGTEALTWLTQRRYGIPSFAGPSAGAAQESA